MLRGEENLLVEGVWAFGSLFLLRGHSELGQEWAQFLGVASLEVLDRAGDFGVSEKLGDSEDVLREVVHGDRECPSEVVWPSDFGVHLGLAF